MEINKNINEEIYRIAINSTKNKRTISYREIANMFFTNQTAPKVTKEMFGGEVLKYGVTLARILQKSFDRDISLKALSDFSNTYETNISKQLETILPGITKLLFDDQNSIDFKKEHALIIEPFLKDENPFITNRPLLSLLSHRDYFFNLANLYIDHNFGENRKKVNKKILEKYPISTNITNIIDQQIALESDINIEYIDTNSLEGKIKYIIQNEINSGNSKPETLLFELCATNMRLNQIKAKPKYATFAQDLTTNDFLRQLAIYANKTNESEDKLQIPKYISCRQLVNACSNNGVFDLDRATEYLKRNPNTLINVISSYVNYECHYNHFNPDSETKQMTNSYKKEDFFTDTLKPTIKKMIEVNPFTNTQEIINTYLNKNFDQKFLGLTKDEFISILLKDFIVSSNANPETKLTTMITDPKANSIALIELNPQLLSFLIDNYNNNNFGYKQKTSFELTDEEKQNISNAIAKVEEDRLEKNKFSNTQIYNNINKCREDIINGSQFNHQRISYSHENMYATTDMGKTRSNQEDSVIIANNPNAPECKLLVVADGIGGFKNGELASLKVTNEMLKWFESLSPLELNGPTLQLQKKYIEQISKVSRKIYEDPNINGGGSTFVGALVTNNATIIANVGDSRGYIYQNDELRQITTDDSKAQDYYEQGFIKNKDDMRFYVHSNIITQMMGTPNVRVSSQIIPNTYDKVILLSDGVTDCLSDDQIKIITKNTPAEELTDAIVDTALKTTSYRPDHLGKDRNYLPEINGGKDNTTAAVLDNNGKRR